MSDKTRASTSNQRGSHASEREPSSYEAFEEQSRLGAGLFEQALENYEQTLKAGLRLQEESARWWTHLLKETSAPSAWEKAAQPFQGFPAAQRRWLDDAMRSLEQNSRRSLELLQKAGEAAGTLSPSEAQARLQQLWEGSLQLLRSNAEAVTAANHRALEAWMELLRRSAEMTANGRGK
jgi:hypothetical protein